MFTGEYDQFLSIPKIKATRSIFRGNKGKLSWPFEAFDYLNFRTCSVVLFGIFRQDFRYSDMRDN